MGEFFAQGDLEKKRGIPVQMLNDRDKVNKPNSQIGFIEFIIAPLVAAEVKIFPSWYETSVLLEANLRGWERLWVQETNPVESEREKVRERAQRIEKILNNKPIEAKVQANNRKTTTKANRTSRNG